MQPVYEGEFKSYADLPYGDNNPTEDAIIYAAYDIDGYEGSAIVVFERDGEIYENHDSHCSCNGLENWSPEKAVPKALREYRAWRGLEVAVYEWEKARQNSPRTPAR